MRDLAVRYRRPQGRQRVLSTVVLPAGGIAACARGGSCRGSNTSDTAMTTAMASYDRWKRPQTGAFQGTGSIFLDNRAPKRTAVAISGGVSHRWALDSIQQPPTQSMARSMSRTMSSSHSFPTLGSTGAWLNSPSDAVHRQYHSGGSIRIESAGVRTATSPSSSGKWTTQTGKPSAGVTGW